jgi:hypothetical protein
MLSKHLIDKKSTFKHVLPNTCAILKSNDFKNAIFKNAIFKIALIKIALPNRPLGVIQGLVFAFVFLLLILTYSELNTVMQLRSTSMAK